MTNKSLNEIQEEAENFITGGMSSSFRANFYNGLPMYANKAHGPRFTDCTGKEFIDFFMCNGSVILGHDRYEVKSALHEVIEKGFFAGFDDWPTVNLAKKICKSIPAAEQIRFVNSGTEGTLLSLRLARGHTNRDLIIRIDGHYHGCQDYLFANNLVSKIDLSNDGSKRSKTIGRTSGVPEAMDSLVVTIPWNNFEILEKVLLEEEGKVAGIIMNVIDYNNGVFLTTPEYLNFTKEQAKKYGIVLIFDEVLSGFKTGISCGQGYYGVVPDICIIGKALSNNVPLGVVAGKKEVMKNIMDPINPVGAGGTFSGNQFGVAAGNASLDILMKEDFYKNFLFRADQFYEKLKSLFREKGLPAVVQHLGAGFHIFLGTEEPINKYTDLNRVDRDLTRKFFNICIENGLYFHTDFTISEAHDELTLNEALEKIDIAIKKLKY